MANDVKANNVKPFDLAQCDDGMCITECDICDGFVRFPHWNNMEREMVLVMNSYKLFCPRSPFVLFKTISHNFQQYVYHIYIYVV